MTTKTVLVATAALLVIVTSSALAAPPCTIKGVPCTAAQIEKMAQQEKLIQLRREWAAAIGRRAGDVPPGDTEHYAFQQLGFADRKDRIDTPSGSMEWWYYDDFGPVKAVSILNGKVYSVHD